MWLRSTSTSTSEDVLTLHFAVWAYAPALAFVVCAWVVKNPACPVLEPIP